MFNEEDEKVDINLTPPRAFAKKSTKHKAQKFRTEWLNEVGLKTWLVSADDLFRAKCKLCNCTMVVELTKIKAHDKGNSYKEIVACKEVKQKSITSFTTNKTPTKLDVNVKTAEIKLTAFLAEHNTAFLATDHLS